MPQSSGKNPLELAAEWVGRITAVGIEMVLPGLGGKWLDDRWGTTPVLMVLGFGIGMAAGLWHLIVMTSSANKVKKNDSGDARKENQQE